MPAAPEKLSARRLGDDVYVTLTVPAKNIDNSMPADVGRIDLYAVTALTPPSRLRFFDHAAKVASVDVAPAPRPGETAQAGVAAPSATDPVQGQPVTVHETMAAADLEPKAVDVPLGNVRGATASRENAVVAPPPASSAPKILRRFYLAVPLSPRGRQGPPSEIVELPLLTMPGVPEEIAADYTEESLTLSWQPPGGIVGELIARDGVREAAPLDEAPVESIGVETTGPTRYNVYRVDEAAKAPVAGAPAAPVVRGVTPPAPTNPMPLDALLFTDTVVLGEERCYVVRAVRTNGAATVEGAPSPPLCITPEDRFAPTAPTGLSAVAAEGSISLIWEPNGEADLGGYVVLRGRPGDATLVRLTEMPIGETRYTDRTAVPGERYVYAVQAVDMQTPPNVSEESNRVEETAR